MGDTGNKRENVNDYGSSQSDMQSTDVTTHDGGCVPVHQYKCDLCKKSFTKYVKLQIHMRVHPKELRAGVVAHTFDTYGCLKQNVCASKASRSCKTIGEINDSNECSDDVSAQSSDITASGGVCLPVHPYACDICDKTLVNSENLKLHRRTHTGERPHKCDMCEKSFGRSANLINHRRTHTGERPYKCDLCKKSFAESGSLKKHRIIHTGERPYKCDIGLCKKSFTRSTHLSDHKRDHTENRLIFCGICGDSFKGTSTLWTHIGVDHSKDERQSTK